MKIFYLVFSCCFLRFLTPFSVDAQCDPEPFAAQNRWWSTNATRSYLINFSTGQAVLEATTTNSSGLGFEGSAVAVNPVTNELLFYTDGNRVFRASDNALSPTLVGANASATEAAAIIPMPGGVLGDDFVVFGNTTNVTPGNLITASYKLSTNTISDVTTRLTGIGEALEVIPKTNGIDYWILVNASGQTRVYSYTAADGFDNSLVSSVSLNIASSNRGTISWIPQLPGNVLIGNYSNNVNTGIIGIADFNRETGQLSNYVEELRGALGYAPAISPNGRYIYYVTGNEGWQGTARIFDRQTKEVIKSSVSTVVGGAKLAPDGKIYWAVFNNTQLLTHSNPNDPLTGEFGIFSVSPATSGFNLPNNTYWACEAVCDFSPVPELAGSTFNASCPQTTFDLTTVTANNLPPGFEITWHTATPATGGNRLADPTTVTSGTFFAAFFNTDGNCYGNNGATAQFAVTTPECKVSGQVFHDAGAPDGLINTSGGNTVPVTMGAGYISLVDAGNVVFKTASISGDGTYSFSGVAPGSYTVVMHNQPGGSTQSTLNTAWVSTAEGNINDNPAGDGTPDGKTAVVFVDANVQGVNFGIQQRPSTSSREVGFSDILLNAPITLSTQPLQGNDPEDGNYGPLGSPNSRFRIKSLPANALLAYNNLPVTIGQLITPYEADKLTITFTNPDLLGQSPTATFTYTVVDDAGFESATPANYIVNVTTPLPAVGLALSAKLSGKDHLLVWVTKSESNTDRFEIEASENGVHFRRIGTEAAAGLSHEQRNYRFVVENIAASSYYRLLLLDKDGTSRYSNVAYVKHNANIEGVRVYPNPIPEQFTIFIPEAGMYNISLLTAAGKRLQEQRAIVPQGGMVVPVSRRAMARGIYLLQIRNERNGENIVQKVMIR
jgi:hypothetical protein